MLLKRMLVFERDSACILKKKVVPLPLFARPKWAAAAASSGTKTVLGTREQLEPPKPGPGAGSALCISRGQGTGGPTGRPTPNQPVGAVSTMPLHPLDRKSAAQPLPSGFAAYYFRPWTR